MSLNKEDLEFGQVVYKGSKKGVFIGNTDELYPDMKGDRSKSVEVVFADNVNHYGASTVNIDELSLNKVVPRFTFTDEYLDEYEVKKMGTSIRITDGHDTLSFYEKDIDNIIKLFTDFKEFYSNK